MTSLLERRGFVSVWTGATLSQLDIGFYISSQADSVAGAWSPVMHHLGRFAHSASFAPAAARVAEVLRAPYSARAAVLYHHEYCGTPGLMPGAAGAYFLGTFPFDAAARAADAGHQLRIVLEEQAGAVSTLALMDLGTAGPEQVVSTLEDVIGWPAEDAWGMLESLPATLLEGAPATLIHATEALSRAGARVMVRNAVPIDPQLTALIDRLVAATEEVAAGHGPDLDTVLAEARSQPVGPRAPGRHRLAEVRFAPSTRAQLLATLARLRGYDPIGARRTLDDAERSLRLLLDHPDVGDPLPELPAAPLRTLPLGTGRMVVDHTAVHAWVLALL